MNSGLTKTEVGYCSVFFDRLKPVSVLENGNYWAHIDFIICISYGQKSLMPVARELLSIAETVSRKLYKEVPVYIDRSLVESDTKIMNLLTNNILHDELGEQIDSHVKKCEEHMHEIQTLLKNVNENNNIKNNYLFSRLVELKQKSTGADAENIACNEVQTDDMIGLLEFLFGDRFDDRIFSMVYKCVEDDKIRLIAIGNSKKLQEVYKKYTRNALSTSRSFSRCIMALSGNDPIIVTATKKSKQYEWYIVPVDDNSIIVSADAEMISSSMITHSNPRVWNLE